MKTRFAVLSLLLILPSIFFAQDVDQTESNTENAAIVEASEEKDIGSNCFTMLKKEPAPINIDEVRAAIGYPTISKEKKIEGKVVVRILVDKEGNYVKYLVLKNPDDELTKAVTDHIPKLKFTPCIQDGKPIKVWMTIPFNFEMK